MFLDDTACNLASLNLTAFYDPATRSFDTAAFTHAARLWTVVLEISVLMAQYPSPTIAQLSYDYRTLGLGYANLGTLLMLQGIPYDSPEALAQTGAYTALLGGVSYATSAEMARELGPFPSYLPNADAMLRVIRNHRRAAYGADPEEYECLTVTPRGLDPEADCPLNLVAAAQEVWDQALELGEQYGYRNAQTTLIAPTGTIGLLMDCDTTGIEPDFALVKFKKLAGGGHFRIINQSVPAALRALGYSGAETRDIVAYCAGTNSLDGAPHINSDSLAALGFTPGALDAVENALTSAFDVTFAFNRWTLGEDFCKETLGLSEAQLADPSHSLLEHLGFTREQITAANDVITGRMTIEGAPHLHEEHYAVFDCANRCGRYGTRFIAPMAHVRAMATAQPFLSGAISKTINMPADATVDDVRAVYDAGATMMLKALALYRDGSKLSQPLASMLLDAQDLDAEDLDAEDLDDEGGGAAVAATPPAMQPTRPSGKALADAERVAAVAEAERILSALPTEDARDVVRRTVGLLRGDRISLPSRRNSIAQKARIGGHTIYLHMGMFEDGSLGEIFINMSKDGAAFRSMMNCFAIAVSIGLQHGVPLDAYMDSFVFTKFEPNGTVTGNDQVKMASSIIDYLFRELGITFLGRADLSHLDAPGVPAVPTPGLLDDSAMSAGEPDAAGLPLLPAGGGVQASLFAAPVATAVPPVAATQSRAAQVRQALELGFEGSPCNDCGQLTMVRNGTCLKCMSCGATDGCS